jgi:predicted ATPase
MTKPPPDPVSRVPESQAITQFLASATSTTSGLFVEGEAGIGKTTLWLEACEQAARQGFRVLTAHGDPSEVSLVFAAVADLLANVDHVIIDQLPAVQRAALNRILLRDSDIPAADERAAAAAFQGVIQHLAANTPVLIAIDDVQWLDASSAAVVRFAGRRLSGAVGVLVTARVGEPESLGALPLQLGHAIV